MSLRTRRDPTFSIIRFTGAAAVLGLLAVHPKPTSADTWLGTTDSNWAVGSNWSTGSQPTSGETVLFSGNPPNFPNLPTGTTKVVSVAYDAAAVDFNLGTPSETLALTTNLSTGWTAIEQDSGTAEAINATVKVYVTQSISQSNQVALIKLVGAGGLNLPTGLQWGNLSSSTVGNLLAVAGPGPLSVGGTIRGDINSAAGTPGGTAHDIRLDGDATSGSMVSLNPTDAASWVGVRNVILNGRVNLNVANAGAITASTTVFQFNSGARDASLLVTGVSGAVLSRNITFNSVTAAGSQTIGVNLPSPGFATITSNLALTPANLNPALFAGPGSNAYFTGSITGSRPLSITGTGIVTITNAAGYTGPMTVNANATLAGAGTGGSLTVNGTISPGDNTTAQLTTAAQTWNPAGTYKWEINDAAGSAGNAVGWDKVAFTTLSILADSNNKFTIRIVGNPVNFGNQLSYSWTIASANTPGGITGFNTNAFVLDDTAFTAGTGGGTFAIGQSGDDLNVSFTPGAAPEPGAAALLLIGALALGRRPRR